MCPTTSPQTPLTVAIPARNTDSQHWTAVDHHHPVILTIYGCSYGVGSYMLYAICYILYDAIGAIWNTLKCCMLYGPSIRLRGNLNTFRGFPLFFFFLAFAAGLSNSRVRVYDPRFMMHTLYSAFLGCKAVPAVSEISSWSLSPGVVPQRSSFGNSVNVAALGLMGVLIW